MDYEDFDTPGSQLMRTTELRRRERLEIASRVLAGWSFIPSGDSDVYACSLPERALMQADRLIAAVDATP